MTKKYFALSFILPSVVVLSCGTPSEPKEDPNQEEKTTAQNESNEAVQPSEATFKLDLIIANNIAAPVKLLTDMNQAGLNNYREEVTIPTDQASAFSTSDEKAIGFGVYGADLSYKSLYGKNQEMADYLIAIRNLSEDLGLSSLFDQHSMERFEKIKSNPDSVKMFIFDKYDQADSYLRDNDRITTAALILTGGLIESLHLVSSQIETGDINKEAYMIFLGQKNTLKSILDLYESLEKEGKSISAKKDIEMLYNKFKEVDSFEKFSKQNIHQLHVAIDEVRDRLV